MKQKTYADLEIGLEQMVSDFNDDTADPKFRIGALKSAVIIEKILVERDKVLEDIRNRNERLLLDGERFVQEKIKDQKQFRIDESKLELEKIKQETAQELSNKQLLLDQKKFMFEKKQKKLENELELGKLELEIQRVANEQEKNKIARMQLEEDIKSRERESTNNRIKLGIEIGVAVLGLVPAVLAFAGGILSLKLEYLDNGRSPSTFKDFMRAIKTK